MADEASMEGKTPQQVTGESSQSTVEINVKTLDGQTFSFRVGKNMPVPVLKEKLANASGVPTERQRLIYRGRVLKDNLLLSEYNLEDGDTLHMVPRQPVQEQPSPGAGNDSGTGASRNRIGEVTHSVVLGSVNLGDQGGSPVSDISQIVGVVLNSLGVGALMPVVSSGDVQSATDVPLGGERQGSQTAPSRAASGTPSNFNTFNQAFQFLHPNSQSAAAGAPSVIPDSLATITEFIRRMELALQNGSLPPQPANTNDLPHSQIPSTSRRGIPTPEMLGSVMEQVQQLLGSNVTTALTRVATGLSSESTLVDAVERDRIQSEAMHVGVAMHHLGAMLLELSRTIMTLRMGQSPDESILNPGPAVFISPSGPSPIMVQPFTSQLNTLFGGPSPPPPRGAPTSGPHRDPSRNINIHIHAGGTITPGVSLANSRASSTDVGRGEQPSSGGGNATADSASSRGIPSRTVVAAIPARGTSQAGRMINVMYPVQVSTQLSGPFHSAPGPRPPLSSGTQPEMPLPLRTLEPAGIPSLVAQINSQLAAALGQNAQGSNSSQNEQPTNSTQGPSLATNEVQTDSNRSSSQNPVPINSQISSGNNQGQISQSSLQNVDSSRKGEGSQLVSPGMSSHAQTEVVIDDLGGSASAKSPVVDSIMPGVEGGKFDQVSRSAVMPDSSSTVTSAETCDTEKKGKNSAETVHDSATKSSQDGQIEKPAPLGLGLGGLQPKRRSKHPKPSDGSSTSQNQQAIARGQQFLNSFVSQSPDANGENTNDNPLLSMISQMQDSLPVDRTGNSGQVDVGDMMSSIFQSPGINNMLAEVSNQTGLGSSSTDLRNMLGQVMQSPGLRNTMNDFVQQMQGNPQGARTGRGRGELDFSRMIQQMLPAVSQALGEVSESSPSFPSSQPDQAGAGRGQGGLDFSRMFQQMLPVMSQALGGASESSVPIPSSQRDQPALPESKSKVDLLQAVESIGQDDSAGGIFRAVLENASHLSAEGNNDLVNSLAENEELTNEFENMLARDLHKRLQQDRPSED